MRRVYISDEFTMGIGLADAYCFKRSWLFNKLFGWREATRYLIGGVVRDCHLYILPKAVAYMLESVANGFESIVVDNDYISVVY